MASKKGFKSKLKFKSCKLKHFGAKASASALAIYAFDDGQKATTKWLIQEGNKIANSGYFKKFPPLSFSNSNGWAAPNERLKLSTEF